MTAATAKAPLPRFIVSELFTASSSSLVTLTKVGHGIKVRISLSYFKSKFHGGMMFWWLERSPYPSIPKLTPITIMLCHLKIKKLLTL